MAFIHYFVFHVGPEFHETEMNLQVGAAIETSLALSGSLWLIICPSVSQLKKKGSDIFPP
jgi:hypothetical protein